MSIPPAPLPGRRPTAPTGRRLLLGAVIIGLLTLQFLSGHDSAGDHRMLSPASGSAATVSAWTGDPAAMPSSPGALPAHIVTGADSTDSTGSKGGGIVAGCALLLLVGVIAAFAVARRRRDRLHGAARVLLRSGSRRGPPNALPRLALCVERI